MCLIAWNWQPDSSTPLLLIANRDEFYARPTAPLAWWVDAQILAGRDLQAGGTWLGVSQSGRLAALTNHRNPADMRTDAPSRGELVSTFLSGDMSAQDYLAQLAPQAANYNPFNLLVYDGSSLLGLESRNERIVNFEAGVGAVSNADFETPWPKLAALKSRLRAVLDRGEVDDAQLLDMLYDRSLAADGDLPSTGIPLDLERSLSATFVHLPDYGTRACSLVRMDRNVVRFVEQSFDVSGERGTVEMNLALKGGVQPVEADSKAKCCARLTSRLCPTDTSGSTSPSSPDRAPKR